MSSKKSIVIVDDHPLMRKGMAMILESDMAFQVVGQAESAEEAMQIVPELNPDLAVVVISLPCMNGIELIKNLLSRLPDLTILIVSRHDEQPYAYLAIRS